MAWDKNRDARASPEGGSKLGGFRGFRLGEKCLQDTFLYGAHFFVQPRMMIGMTMIIIGMVVSTMVITVLVTIVMLLPLMMIITTIIRAGGAIPRAAP